MAFMAAGAFLMGTAAVMPYMPSASPGPADVVVPIGLGLLGFGFLVHGAWTRWARWLEHRVERGLRALQTWRDENDRS